MLPCFNKIHTAIFLNFHRAQRHNSCDSLNRYNIINAAQGKSQNAHNFNITHTTTQHNNYQMTECKPCPHTSLLSLSSLYYMIIKIIITFLHNHVHHDDGKTSQYHHPSDLVSAPHRDFSSDLMSLLWLPAKNPFRPPQSSSS